MQMSTLALFIFVFHPILNILALSLANEIMYKYRDMNVYICVYKACTHEAMCVKTLCHLYSTPTHIICNMIGKK